MSITWLIAAYSGLSSTASFRASASRTHGRSASRRGATALPRSGTTAAGTTSIWMFAAPSPMPTVQVAPSSLPRLKKGLNHLNYEAADRYGLATIPMLVNPNCADPNNLAKYLVAMPQDYDPKRATSRIRGDAVLRLAAPEGMKIAWFSAGATFRTHQAENAKNTNNRIAYAVGRPQQFKEIYRASVPAWVNHWRYNWDADVVLDQPAKQVYVKYTADPALN